MSPKQQETRQVCVLEPFRDREGNDRSKGEVFAAAYANPRQQQAVNEMVHRGFLTFEVQHAAQIREDHEREEIRRKGQAPEESTDDDKPAEEAPEQEPEPRAKRGGRRA